MLKELFEKDFFVTFPHRNGVIPNVREYQEHGDFVLSDNLACNNDCPNNGLCNHQVLLVKNDNAEIVNIIDLNDVLGILQEPFHDNADFVFCKDDTFWVVELTCISNQFFNENNGNTYPQGKRAKARAQLEMSIIAFYACPPIKQFIERHHKKAIVAYRINDEKLDSKAAKDFNPFIEFQNEILDSSPVYTIENDFEMEIIKYPKYYNI